MDNYKKIATPQSRAFGWQQLILGAISALGKTAFTYGVQLYEKAK